MENYPYSTYPDSGNSSPRSREIDSVDNNASWDDPPSSNYKVKFMCSYGGKIHPRPHDNQLTYVGGDTKILAVDRSIRFSLFMSKLSSLCSDADLCFKYQLPGEDLDALISVTNDEDLEHMMLEYDRLFRASARPARLRLFLFPLNPPPSNFSSEEAKSERQWFVDALNSVQIQNLEDSSPPASVSSAATPDFLFGLDKGHAPPDAAPKPAPTVPEVFPKEIPAGSEDRHVVGDPVDSPSEIQRQIHELQRLQISNHEQAMIQRKNDEANARAYYGDFYAQQKIPENFQQPQQAVPVSIPTPYWQDRNMTTGGYPVAASLTEPPVYLVPTSAGVYQAPPAIRPVTGQVGQAYYGMQRVVPEGYREQPVYNAVPPQSIQQPRMGAYTDASGMVRPSNIGVAEHGYAQVSYDGAGRQVYYTAPGRVVPQYQAATGVADARQGGGPLNQEGKDASHTSSV